MRTVDLYGMLLPVGEKCVIYVVEKEKKKLKT